MWNRIDKKLAWVGSMSLQRRKLRNILMSSKVPVFLLVLVSVFTLSGCSTQLSQDPGSAIQASTAQQDSFPIEVTFEVSDQGNIFNLHLSRVLVASQVGSRAAETGTVFLIIYYDAESKASYPVSFVTRQFSFYCGDNTHYGTVLDAVSDLAIDAKLLRNGQTVESFATNFQPGVRKSLATVFQVPLTQLANNPRLKIYDNGFKEIKLSSLASWAASQLPNTNQVGHSNMTAEASENKQITSSDENEAIAGQTHQALPDSLATKKEEREIEQDPIASTDASTFVQQPVMEEKADDFSSYEADLNRRIKRAWFPPMGHQSDRVAVTFTLGPGGELSYVRVAEPSDSEIANQAALKAVENAAPFRAIPSAIPAPIDVRFTFDYNKYAGGGKSEIVRVAE